MKLGQLAVTNILCIICLVLINFTAFSQIKLGFGVGLGVPTGALDDVSDIGIGGFLEGKYGVSDRFDLGLFVGYYGFLGSEIANLGSLGTVDVSGSRVIPLTITGDLNFPSGFYTGIGLGTYFVNLGEIDFSVLGLTASTPFGKETKFGVAPRLGFTQGLYNMTLSYHIVNNGSFIGLNIGLLFGM